MAIEEPAVGALKQKPDRQGGQLYLSSYFETGVALPYGRASDTKSGESLSKYPASPGAESPAAHADRSSAKR